MTNGDEGVGEAAAAGDEEAGNRDAGDRDVGEPVAPTHRHRVRRITAVVIGVAVLAGVGWFARAWSQRGAKEVSVERAKERAATGSTQVKAGLRPATGVYSYTADGSETLSVLGTAQRWGDTLPLTVSATENGCWQTRVDFSTNHRHTQGFCPADGELHEVSGRVFQRFDFVAAQVEDETVFTCDPPVVTLRLDAEPGDHWSASCQGTSPARGTKVTSAGTNTFVGPETLTIGGTKTPTLHYRLDRTLSGDQSGTDVDEYWYDAETGLLLKGSKNTDVASPSPVGDIHYTEKGVFELTSVTPEN